MAQSEQYLTGLCAIAKDETPYLREWVGYHYYIGFEKIIIYDNESKIPVRETLKDFCDAGICETYTIYGLAQQNIAYNHYALNEGKKCHWLAFFDLDEFLCLKSEKDIRVILQDYESYSALSIQWDVFSSSGHLTRPNGFVTLNHTESLEEVCISKCIVKTNKFKLTYSSHHFGFKNGYAVNPNYEIALGGYAPLATDKICLNHYVYRSQQDYADKINKTDATFGEKNVRQWRFFYDQAKKPTKKHTAILPVAHEVYDMMQKGLPVHRYAITYKDIKDLSINEIIMLISKILSSNMDMAEVIFSIGYRKFFRSKEYIKLGISIFLITNKKHRVVSLTNRLMSLEPDINDTEDAYLKLFKSMLLNKEFSKAKRLLIMLHEYATDLENKKLSDELNHLMQKYHLHIK